MTMALVCLCAALGIVTLLAAARTSALAAYMILFPTVVATPGVLMPLLIAESLGLRQLGALLGIEGVFSTIGFAAGPVIAGRIYDLTHSYSGALCLFFALSVASAAAMLVCRPVAQEPSRSPLAASASAAFSDS